MTKNLRSIAVAAACIASAAVVILMSIGSAEARYQRWFDLQNRSGQTITTVHATHVGRNDWGGDLLGADVLPAGRQVRLDPPRHQGFCRFDVRVGLADGRSLIGYGLDLCTATTITCSSNSCSVH